MSLGNTIGSDSREAPIAGSVNELTSMEKIHDATSNLSARLAAIHSRIMEANDRLTGSRPHPDGDNTKTPNQPGILGDIMGNLDLAHNIAGIIENELRHLEESV